MVRHITYTDDEYELLFGRDPQWINYPEEGEGPYIKEDELTEAPNENTNACPSDADIPTLVEALENLQLIQNQEVTTSDESSKDSVLYQQLRAEIASLRMLLAAAQKESQQYRRSHFHAHTHPSPSHFSLSLLAEAHDDVQSPVKSVEITAREPPVNKSKQSESPRSRGLPPHLVAAGFRMCHESQ